MIGRMIDIGTPIARVNWLWVNSFSGAQAMTAPVVRSAATPMPTSSQKPGRVSKDQEMTLQVERGAGHSSAEGLVVC